MAGAIRRFPFLADAEVVRLVCHPDAMTPDANPLLGPLPDVRGLWVAAGLSLNGFGGAGGIGRALAGWITAGDPDADIGPYRAWRFADTYRDPTFAAGLGRETYSDYYRLRYPFDADVVGRPRRLSALHGRLQDAGAVFGTKAGWERAGPARARTAVAAGRAATRRRTAGRTPPWFDRVVAEGRTVRERAGIIDLSSFGTIDVAGRPRPACSSGSRRTTSTSRSAASSTRPGATTAAGWSPTSRSPGSPTDRYRVVTGAGFVASDLAWLRWQRTPGEDVTLRDASEDVATIGLWGPRARDILAAASSDRRDDAALPLRRARATSGSGRRRCPRRASATPASSGWELSTDPNWAVEVWDRLRRGLEPRRSAPSRSATGPSTRSGWRRATATSAST